MTRDDALKFTDDTPVLCKDGRIGLLIRIPADDAGFLGVQVPHEADIRSLPLSAVTARGKGLCEDGVPNVPAFPRNIEDRLMLALYFDSVDQTES